MSTKPTVGVPWLLPLVAGLLGLALTLILAFQLLPSRYELKEGEVSRDTIKSPSQVSFISQVLTKNERDRAEAQVPEVLREDRNIATEQMSSAKETNSRIGSILFSSGRSTEEKRAMLVGLPALSTTPQVAATLVGLSPGSWSIMESEILRLVEVSMRGRISALELAQVRGELEGKVTPSLPANNASVVAQLAAGFIRPNVVLDQEATGQARKAAREAVAPVRVALEKGETIVRDGEV
ncbi:MAG: hypothetical protein Q8P59_13980, partial [Dehalococcoidia bacterium]|nr:hypothetical protein [Dehalococcoidia bacterium]